MKNETYRGFKEVQLNENELSDFYSHYQEENYNPFNILYNEYVIIKDENNNIVDKYKYQNRFESIPYVSFDSKMFGKIKPRDAYQLFAMDSLLNNQLTIIRGKAGSGKSLLALGFLFQQLERGLIDKIILFSNPVAVRGAAKLG